MLKVLKTQKIPVVIFSAVFRDNHRFFSGIFRRYWSSVLKRVDYFHVQDEVSAQLLKSIGVEHICISGDTRYDRVWEVAQNAKVIDRYISWKGQSLVVVLGSSYITEEEAIAGMVEMSNGVKWVIAPHHIDEANVVRIEKMFAGKTQRATDSGELRDLPVLILNTMGDLGGLYKLGEVAIVGGGWGKGIHNVLEPAAHGCAVLWGPAADKFLEAKLLMERGGGVQVKSQGELVKQLREWIGNNVELNQVRQSAKEMVLSQIGAEAKVLKTIGEFWGSEKR
jgi:3-deoxy-D-manno-octulosonic-acid transferase